MTNHHGSPCWFELGTGDPDGAADFYGGLLGWQVRDSGMEGIDYRLAQSDGDMVAGLMPLSLQTKGAPPNWLIYFAVDSADDAVRDAARLGGTVVQPPHDIPGTGRFAILTDPQGAPFGILQPEPMETEPASGAFDQARAGHGNWIELATPDPAGALSFYAGLLRWTPGEAMDMGPAGTYRIVMRGDKAIGGMMDQGGAPGARWLPYFGVENTGKAIEAIRAAGGTVHHGPQEVPGGAFIAIAQDPQGACFAVVGPAASE